MNYRQYLTRPLLQENPITVQVLGLCSALAVSRSLRPALIMAASVFCVLVFSNLAVSLLRGVLPRSIRLILEVTIIASAVIVVDEMLKAYAPDISQVLSVFVGLIITNCIVLGRTEAFAMRHGPLASIADAAGNGAAYAAILLLVAAIREIFGSGTLLEFPILPLTTSGGWYLPNEMMLYAPSAFFIIGLLIWAISAWRRDPRRSPRSEPVESPAHLKYQETAG
jgi:Na+-transporting NADH:ubiquinone oxidoreductase subunit D